MCGSEATGIGTVRASAVPGTGGRGHRNHLLVAELGGDDVGVPVLHVTELAEQSRNEVGVQDRHRVAGRVGPAPRQVREPEHLPGQVLQIGERRLAMQLQQQRSGQALQRQLHVARAGDRQQHLATADRDRVSAPGDESAAYPSADG